MENFALQLASDPLTYVGYIFALFGAVGVLIFCAGFFGSVKHLFTYSEGTDHMEHARTRALWGLYLCMVTLGFWELIRLVFGQVPLSSLVLIIILLSPAWIPWLKGLITGKSGGH